MIRTLPFHVSLLSLLCLVLAPACDTAPPPKHQDREFRLPSRQAQPTGSTATVVKPTVTPPARVETRAKAEPEPPPPGAPSPRAQGRSPGASVTGGLADDEGKGREEKESDRAKDDDDDKDKGDLEAIMMDE